MADDNDIDKLINEWSLQKEDVGSQTGMLSPGVTIEETPEWVVPDTTWNIIFDELNDAEDRSYGILPVELNPEVYTSHEQRDRHDKYPALQKAWEDYLALFALTKGEPPNVE